MTRSLLLALGLLLAAPRPSAMGAATAGFPTEDDFVVVSDPASPRVAYALQRERGRLTVVVEAAADGEPTVALGLHGAATLVLSDKDAVVRRSDGAVRFTFSAPGDWSALRLGLAVAWAGGPFGQPRQRERFRHTGGAPHAPLSTNPADWLPLDLAEHEALVADRRKRIAFDFEQPMEGKATIVLEDAAGQRVRNLLAGRPLARGRHRIPWDGLDEQGNVASAGTYRWRAISHPGVRPEYLFSFCNDGNPPWRTGSGTDMWGPDHSTLTAAAAGDEWTFLGGSCAESGYAMVAVDAAGVKRMHYNQVHGTGLWKIALAAGGRFLYAAHDGFAWGQHVDRKKPDWKAPMSLTLTRFDVKSGQVVPFPGNQRFAVVSTLEVGPGSANPKWEGAALGGLAFLDGKLYVSNRASNAVVVLDAETAKKVDDIPLDGPGALAAHAGRLLAVSKNAIVRVDPVSKKAERVVAGLGSPEGVAADAAGRVYVSDGQSHTVRVFDAGGRALREIGKPGGPYAGPYDPERMVHPRGLAVAPNGWLWVTEERWNPKRAVAWDLAAAKVAKEKFGPTAYGASEAGFDEADPTRWIGQGAAWKLDFARKGAAPTSILFTRPGHVGGFFKQAQYAFHRQDGRTFVVGLGGVTSISELRPDGTLRDLAFVGSTHRLCFACDWNPPAAFVEAFDAAYPTRKGKHADKGPGVLWVDSNGDGLCQADEFDFSTESDHFAGAYWGHRLHDLTIRVPATVRGRRVLVTLEPQGFLPSGAPKYPKLNAACAAAKPVDLGGNEIETAVDRFGRVVANSDPEMKCFAPDGRTLWAYPNRWTNVHGSHNAPLPETGVMQGALYFLGMARFDDQADVFVMNGNHGRFFALTSDGFYLDEMFKDVRMGAAIDAYLIGGECFGGFFGRAAPDGTFYLQSGHTDYRLFRLHGLAEARRSQGTVTVAPEQAIAAANNQVRTAASAAAGVREAAGPFRSTPPTIDGNDGDWPRSPAVRWDKSGKFPVTARIAWDARCLYLFYHVQDPSPWVNEGKDWTALFKTGDSVDLQLGADPKADPTRRGPVPGDLRLLLAPFQGKPVAVLYRHRAPGAADPVTFTSPWRSEKVDSVALVDGAKIAVTKGADDYRVEAAIPLAALGLKPPGVFRADFGALYGDPSGAITMLRSYWANQATGLVNDVPGEIMLHPNLWGTLKLEGAQE
ncbi:MAG TPA: FlgD immunoglobulin-like domain containing protein [Planctomycetota bacterium]|nr:FlgD immunoglobulin-like domain containing protein [Planctomycetota bacterium]